MTEPRADGVPAEDGLVGGGRSTGGVTDRGSEVVDGEASGAVLTSTAAALLRDEPFAPPVADSELVYHGAVWDVRSDRLKYGDGEIVRQWVDHPGAVGVVAVDDDGRVLLIQQYRHPIRHRDWELPAGLRDVDGEDLVVTAQRELAEEADLHAAHWEPLISIFPTPGGNSEVIDIFLATGLSAAPEVHAREAEEADIRLAWVPLADAATAVLDGRMRNAALAVGVLAAERRLSGRRNDGGSDHAGRSGGDCGVSDRGGEESARDDRGGESRAG